MGRSPLPGSMSHTAALGKFPRIPFGPTRSRGLTEYIHYGYTVIDMLADTKALPPLSPAVVHILLALSAGERHGYAIMKEAAEQSEGRVRLGPGTLYRSIQNLLSAGWIEESGERADPSSGDERRRYYRLTGVGREVVMSEARRLSDLVRTARRRRLLGHQRPAEG